MKNNKKIPIQNNKQEQESRKPVYIYILSLLVTILLVSNIITLNIMQKSSKASVPYSLEDSPYPLIEFSRTFRAQEDYIVNLQDIREKLITLIDNNPENNIAIYLEFLNTGANININPELRVFPASLTKVPVAMIIMKKVETGELDINAELTVESKHINDGWGELYKIPIGTSLPLRTFIEESLINSDNTAHEVLYSLVTPVDIEEFGNALGLEDLFDSGGEISAKEYARIFRSLYTSSYLKKDSSHYLLDILTKSKYDEFLGSAISDDIKFAHKFGSKKSLGILLDTGIVYNENKPYLITVMLEYNGSEVSDPDALYEKQKSLIHEISSLIHNHFISL